LHAGVCIAGKTDAEKRLGKRFPIARAKHMSEWADVIRQAFVARRVIDRHWSHGRPFASCLDPVCQIGRTTLRTFLAGRTKQYSAGGTSYPWPDELTAMARRYHMANAPAALRLPHLRSDLVGEQTTDERRLLVCAFAYLSSEGHQDRKYERLFLQYLRVKAASFGLLVHPPGEHGLEQFVEYFNQIRVYGPESNFLRPPKQDEPALNVRATEYRVAPDAWLTALRSGNDFEGGASKEPTSSEAAWIIHFKRDKAKNALPLHGTSIRQMEGQAALIAGALEQKPSRLRMLRGVDICGVEGWQPLWVSAQTLRKMRICSRKTAGRHSGRGLEPLRLTIHAGEDFRWLTSGLRAVAEPFHWKLIERGDRIGHGIAITLHPTNWWKRHEGEVIPVKGIDRLMDLAFLAEYTEGKGNREPRSPDQTEWLRREIDKMANVLWPVGEEGPTIDVIKTAQEFWRDIGGRLTRRLSESPRWSGDKRHERWLYQYLWHRSAQKRADKTIYMKVDDDGNGARTGSDRNERDLLIKVRAALIHEVARWQVCIESNPSSNLVVGSLDSMASQDFLQQRPTREAGFGEETLTWTISTDDPITFSTTLADEYAYAWAGMVLRRNKPYDPAYARALLDEAAATSMRMRFTTLNRGGKRANTTKREGRNHADRP
jgi:hypothetical protein